MSRWTRPGVVVNPTKIDDAEHDRSTVARVMAAHGLPEPRWYKTSAEDPGLGQTRQALAEGCDLVLARGGDGTVRACAAALAGSRVPLGLLPAGTGNLLARNLDLPRELEEAVAVVAAGGTRQIDVLHLDGEPFVVMAGSGFDAMLFEETSDRLKSSVGWGAYAVAAAKALRRARRVPVGVDVDGVRHRFEAVGVVVGNVGTLTAGLELMPAAEADDGLLHAVVLTPRRARDWAGLAARLVTGARAHPFQLTHLSGRHLDVTWGLAMPAQIDGDLAAERTVSRFTVSPANLAVCVPGAQVEAPDEAETTAAR